MKFLMLSATIVIQLYSVLLHAEQVEIDIHGMTCAFCVDSLQRNLGKLPDIKSVEVSLKLKKVRIETIRWAVSQIGNVIGFRAGSTL